MPNLKVRERKFPSAWDPFLQVFFFKKKTAGLKMQREGRGGVWAFLRFSVRRRKGGPAGTEESGLAQVQGTCKRKVEENQKAAWFTNKTPLRLPFSSRGVAEKDRVLIDADGKKHRGKPKGGGGVSKCTPQKIVFVFLKVKRREKKKTTQKNFWGRRPRKKPSRAENPR